MLFSSEKSDLIIGIYEMPHGLLALLIGLLKRKPVVISVIGNPKLDRRNKGIKGRIILKMLKICDVITVTGSVGRNYYIQEKKFNPEKIFILPNSIDTDEFSSNNNEKAYDLITLGRLSSEKGLDFFIDVVAKLKPEFPDIKVGIAGRGELMESLSQQIDNLSLSENVKLLGYVEDPIEFLNSGKLFVTTSKTEGLPRTVIQSIACGTPVIASNAGDMSDLVINNRTGCLIEDYSAENFVEAITSNLNNPEEREKLAKEGKTVVLNKYDHKVATQVWCDIFKSVRL